MQDAYQDVIDYIFDMYAKALTGVYSKAETTVINYNNAKRSVIRSCLTHQQWEPIKETFYQKSKLPRNSSDVAAYLKNRLRNAFDYFLEQEKNNAFAKVGKEGWILSTDAAEPLSSEQKQKLEAITQWLSSHMRTIKLPDLLIEVDNDLHFTDSFFPATRRQGRTAEDICTVLTTIMAYGCNIGPHTMSQMIAGVSYKQIKHVFDWQITDEGPVTTLLSPDSTYHLL